jgi:hypothetical protein
MQLMDFGHQCLHDCSQANGFIRTHRHVAHAELNGIKKRMHANIPPDFFTVVNAFCLDQQLTYSSYSDALEKKSGIPVLGNLSKTFDL